jgi:hypothetical protein
MRKLLANFRHDELSLKGSIVRKVNLRFFCDIDARAKATDGANTRSNIRAIKLIGKENRQFSKY